MTVDNVGITPNGDTLGQKPKPPYRRRAKMKKAPLPPPCQQSNGAVQNCEQMASPHPGDDCAINELLEGTMDLEVVLPDARRVRMTVERRMPMMDLLVQATTANKISPGGHVITLSPEGDRDNLRYKPNTPIGSLDTNTVYIMSKSAINDPPAKKVSRSQLQPFEPTFRLQVNLPRNQLMVMRVSPKTTLAEIKKMVCLEKGFDATRYHLVHPTQPNYLVDLNCKLADYGSTEISLMSDLSVTNSIRSSTSDLIGYAGGEDEKKRKKLLGIFKRKSKSVNNMMIAGETFRDTASSRGISPARSDICDTHSLRAKRQSTKKRAPPPPPVVQPSNNENSATSETPVIVTSTTTSTTVTTTTVSHSRQSSDSSGYHEASVLSDCPDNLSPETSSGCASSGVGIAESPVQHYSSVKRSSRTPTRDKPNFSSVAQSTMLIISTSKKRRAPPPPPLNSNKESGKAKDETNCTANSNNLPKAVNGEPVNSASPINIKKTENLSALEPISPDSLPTSPAASESNASFSPPTSPVCNDTLSSESSLVSSPMHSPSSPADTAVEAQTPNGSNISNHCHTEEETGEVIHLLEKDVKDQKSRQSTDASLSSENDVEMSEMPKIESQVKTGEICDGKQNEKHTISSEIVALNDDTISAEDEYVAVNDVEWDFSIPEPPSPFRNNADNFQLLEKESSPELLEKESSFEEIETDIKTCDNSSEITVSERLEDVEEKSLEDVIRENSLSVSSTDSSVPPLPSSYPPREEIYRAGSESSDVAPPLPVSCPPNESNLLSRNEELHTTQNHILLEHKVDNSATSTFENGNETGETIDNQMFVVAPQPRRRTHLENFSIGSYKNDNSIDILPWSSSDQLHEEESITVDRVNVQKHESSNRKSLPEPDHTNISFNNKNISSEDSQGENFANKDEVVNSPSIRIQNGDHITGDQVSGSTLDESTKIDEAELQEEYKKLQNQLIAWQEQLAKNQTLLQQKQIVSKMNVPVISSISTKPESVEQQSVVYRSQTLPRTKPTVISKELDETIRRSSTMEYHSSLKPQVLTNVTIGSWKSKSDDVFISNPVSDTKPKFQTLAPIISLPQRNSVFPPKRSDNLSLNSDDKSRKSSYISATFDIKPAQSHKELENSSAEKTDGNPALILAQIRNEIKASSRHPAGINVSRTDTNNDSSRLQNSSTKQSTKVSIKSKPHITYSYFGNPSTSSRSMSQTMVSHTKKEIPENGNNDDSETKPVVIATIKSRNSWGPTGVENKDSNKAEMHPLPKVPSSPPPVPVKSRNSWGPTGVENKDNNKAEMHPLPKVSSSPPPVPFKSRNSWGPTGFEHRDIIKTEMHPLPKVSSFSSASFKSRDSLGTKGVEHKDSNKADIHCSPKVSSPPPAPPLPPTTVPLVKDNSKSSDSQIKISRTDPPSDPREELMIEIRKFGGRTALRKVPHNQAGWHLKVFGTLSSTPV